MPLSDLDFYGVDDTFSDEERMVRDTVREFVDKRVIPVISEHWLAGTFPTEIIPELARLGLLGPTIPPEYGGLGASKTVYGIICRELGRGDSGVRSFASVQGSLVMFPIHEYGSEEQKKRWLPLLAKGEAVGCFGLTEPDAGSDPAGLTTRARKEGGDWVLSGAKMWITNGTGADVSVVWAKDDDGVIRGFLVEKGTKGFSAPLMKGKLSLRASVTSELVLDDVRVPDESRLPLANGLKPPLSCLTQARYGIAWSAVGVGIACLEEALSYAKERQMFGGAIARFQLTQAKLADMLTRLTEASLMVKRLGELADGGRMKHYHVSMAKRACVRHGKVIAQTARTILGANGILSEYNSMRHMCNMETVETYEGTHEIHTLVLGRQLTGEDAFR